MVLDTARQWQPAADVYALQQESFFCWLPARHSVSDTLAESAVIITETLE